MYSYSYPDLTKWFCASQYRTFNECRLLEITMKNTLSNNDINEFCAEFAIYICSVRCSSEELFTKMVNALTKGDPLDSLDKTILTNDFYNGFIKDEKYKLTQDYKQSFDDDAIKGYLGEALYYLLRNEFLEDEIITIEPIKPKAVSKNAGIDFLEVRKDDAGYYFVLGEVKTTANSYSSRNQEVIQSFLNRINRNFSEIYFDLKERDTKEDEEYTAFLKSMLDYFYKFKSSDRKRLAGVFNYNYTGQKIRANAFSTWKDQVFDIQDNPVCRRIKIVGIYNIDNVLNQVRDLLWSVL